MLQSQDVTSVSAQQCHDNHVRIGKTKFQEANEKTENCSLFYTNDSTS